MRERSFVFLDCYKFFYLGLKPIKKFVTIL